MTVTVVDPVTVLVGSTVHLTPVKDAALAPAPLAQCSLLGLNVVYATYVKDATGFLITGGVAGSIPGVKVRWTDGVNTVFSAPFTVNVVLPPAVSELGTTSP